MGAKLGAILKANKLSLFPLGNGDPEGFINRRVTQSDLLLRKLTDDNLKDRWIRVGRNMWEQD